MIPFRYVATGIFLFFMSVLLIVVYVAFTKKTNTMAGIDMGQIQQLRTKSKG